MKKLSIIILILFKWCIIIYAQETVSAYDITVDFDRIIHIVLPANVEYVAAGSSVIEAEKVEESPNIVRILAIDERFQSKTNVTIISKGGEVYTYNVTYKEDPSGSSVFFPESEDKTIRFGILINSDNIGHIIFPEDIIYFKQGNEVRFKVEKTTALNILRIKGGSALNSKEKSNLFCCDKKGNIYNIQIGVGTNKSYTYTTGIHEIKANIALNEESIASISKRAIDIKRQIINQGFKKNKFEFSLNNIFVKGEQLFFVFEIQNKSNIDLDIDFVKCFFVDEQELKNSVQQEVIVDYKFNFNFKDKIAAKSRNKFVLTFDKFTIPDKKIIKIEMYEKGGGRHINFKIKNNVIIKAKSI